MSSVEELKSKSAVKQFTNRAERIEEEEELLEATPTELYIKDWSAPFRQTWRVSRPRSREDIMLDCRFSAGNRQSFGYAYLGSIVYDGSRITLLFAETAVTITGRNLDRLYDALCQHRVPFVQEGNETEEDMKPDDEPHIERIEIANGNDEAER